MSPHRSSCAKSKPCANRQHAALRRIERHYNPEVAATGPRRRLRRRMRARGACRSAAAPRPLRRGDKAAKPEGRRCMPSPLPCGLCGMARPWPLRSAATSATDTSSGAPRWSRRPLPRPTATRRARRPLFRPNAARARDGTFSHSLRHYKYLIRPAPGQPCAHNHMNRKGVKCSSRVTFERFYSSPSPVASRRTNSFL